MPQTLSEQSASAYRVLCDSLIGFTRHTFPAYTTPDHLWSLAESLEAVEDGRIRRLLVTMPPRHGKSELVSVRFPAWFLGRNPDKRAVLVSYAADLSQRFSRQVRNVVDSDRYRAIFPAVKLAPDSRSAEAWDIADQRGGLKAVGVGGPLTGHGANLLIIDDPVKNREEASSAVSRQSVWEWYTSTAYTRLEEQGAICLVMTRWHEDDLMGRLIEAQANPGADKWHVLHLPAISDDGFPLWPEKYSLEDLNAIRGTIGGYDWESLYQGRPTAREGSFFKVSAAEIIDAAPASIVRRVRAWDKAATAGGGNYSAGVLMGYDGRYWYVLDVVRGQWSTDERDAMIRQTAKLDGPLVTIRGPQDPGSAGKGDAEGFVRMLAGYTVRTERVTGTKELRADAYSSQWNAGNVKLVKGRWNAAFIEEHRAFPLGAYDDQIDAAADAFNDLVPPPIPPAIAGGQRSMLQGFTVR